MKILTPRVRACASLVALAALAPTALAQKIQMHVSGHDANGNFGAAAVAIGDIDQDGVTDYIVGAPQDDSMGYASGGAYVISGRLNYVMRVHREGTPDSLGGFALAGGHDVNGDGVPDYVISYPRQDVGPLVRAGVVRVFSGTNGALLRTFNGAWSGGELGRSMAFIGDVDLDGVADLAVGAPVAMDNVTGAQGMVRVYSGATGAVISTLQTVFGTIGGFGMSVAGVGDWNGDGRADIVCGLPLWNHGLSPNVGAVRVLSAINGQTIATVLAPQANSEFGRAVASIADIDNDGRREILVGAPKELDLGAAHLVVSQTAHIQMTLRGMTPFAEFGMALAEVGDVNKDGKPDFAVTSPFIGAEAMRVFTTNGVTLWAPLMKSATYPSLGAAVAPLGDIDGDGWLDLVVTDPKTIVAGQMYGVAARVRLAHHQPDLGFDGDGNSFLSVHGTQLSAGGYADVHLSQAGANQPGIFLASPFYTPLPLFGGTLIPHLSGLQIPFVTDANGRFILPGIIPGGLGNVSLYIQAGVVAPTQPQGFGLSNAVRVDFLP